MKTQKLRKFKRISFQPLRWFSQPAIVVLSLLAGLHTADSTLAQTTTTNNASGNVVEGTPVATPQPVAKPVTEDKMSTGWPKEVQDLPNFHKVHDFLYRAGEPTPKGLNQLKEMGVKTLIDLRAPTAAAHNEKAIASKLGMQYINLPMSAEPPTKKQVEKMLKTIDSAQKNQEPVLVHCAHGSDRTGCMIGIYRVARDGWGFDDTYKEMRKYWFGQKYLKLKAAVKDRSSH